MRRVPCGAVVPAALMWCPARLWTNACCCLVSHAQQPAAQAPLQIPVSSCRFGRSGGMGLNEEEVEAFGEYFYHIVAKRGSGEYALRWLLGPFAFARNPLMKKLHELKVRLHASEPVCPTFSGDTPDQASAVCSHLPAESRDRRSLVQGPACSWRYQ